MKYFFLGVIVLSLFSCSGEKLTTDQKVAEIDAATNYTNTNTETVCGTIYFSLDGKDVVHASCDTYMGDGGAEASFYYCDNELIYCEYYSFYDGPMMDENGTYTDGGESIGNRYKVYYENGEMEKCLKDDVEFSDFEDGYDPDPEYLYETSTEILLAVEDTESKVLCNGL
jgi:hypothetical protein